MPDNVEDNPVEKREALLADRLRLHKGYRQRFVKGRNRHGRIHAFHQSLQWRYGVEESFKAKIKRREAALDAFAVAEAYCKESWMVSRCEREGFDGFIIDLCSDAEDETIRLVRLVPDSEDGIMDDVFRLEYGSCEYKV